MDYVYFGFKLVSAGHGTEYCQSAHLGRKVLKDASFANSMLHAQLHEMSQSLVHSDAMKTQAKNECRLARII